MDYIKGNIIADRYELKEILGRGSFGEVWLANDTYSGIDVAIKVFIALDQSGIEEFKSEFRNAFSLSHPNLLHATHFDIIDNKPVLVMPYCPGKAESLIGTSMSEIDVWRFIHDVASGLAYLHSKGVIHRDIKPDNILIDQDGDYLITDFGVSKRMEGTLRRNSTIAISQDQIAGTIGYMAPELFSNHPDTVKATDIWALGASLVEIINGELPFCGQGGGMLLHYAEMPEIKGGYSKQLCNTIISCLAKDTWDRPTAEKLVEISETVLSGGNKVVPLTEFSATLPSKKKSKVWKIISTVLLVSVVIFGAAGVCNKILSKPTPTPSPLKDELLIDGHTSEIVNFPSYGGVKHFKIEKSFEDSWNFSDIPEWCKINYGQTAFSIKCESNIYSSARTARIEFYRKGTTVSLASLEIKQDGGEKKNKTDNNVKTDNKSGSVEVTSPSANNDTSELQSAIKNGDYATVKHYADLGYSQAYLPLAKYYLNNPATHNLADQYAQKAKRAGISGAQRIIDDLTAFGYYN